MLPGQVSATIRLSPAAVTRLELCTRTFMMAILIVLLRRAQWYHLHAATAIDPDGRGWLIAGNAHAGKSTTAALLAALPRLNQDLSLLLQVGGRPPDMSKLPAQCAFVPRCSKVRNECRSLDSPPLEEVAPGHYAACYNPVYHREDDEEE